MIALTIADAAVFLALLCANVGVMLCALSLGKVHRTLGQMQIRLDAMERKQSNEPT